MIPDWRSSGRARRPERPQPKRMYTEIVVQKPYCAPARGKILTALQPRGVIVGPQDIREQVVLTSVKTLLQRFKIELKTWENLKYGGPIGLAMFMPKAVQATVKVRTTQAAWAEYLLAASGHFTIEKGVDRKQREAGYRRNGDMPTPWDGAETRAYVKQQRQDDTPLIDADCREGNALWSQFLDAVETAKAAQAKAKRGK